MRFSILVPSLFERRQLLDRLLEGLLPQVQDKKNVELLVLTDDRKQSTGTKLNALVQAARGEWVTCIGDDDTVSDDYVEEILAAIARAPDADVICFLTRLYRDGEFYALGYTSITYTPRDDMESKEIWRKPMDIMPVRRMHRLASPWPDRWRYADARQAVRMWPDLQKEERIDKVLYHYWIRTDNRTHMEMQAVANAARRT